MTATARRKAKASIEWSPCGRYWFDDKAADIAVDWFGRNLCLTSGEWAGQPFVLDDWQAVRIIRPLFGWKRADGTRRYRRVVVWLPRKNGKSELAAGVGLFALTCDNERGGQGYCLARNRDQARIVFSKAAAMVELSPSLKEHLQPYQTSIYCPALMSALKPLTGSAKGKHGLEPHVIIGDEVHEWEDDELYNFVRMGSASRRQPIEFLISTAGTRKGFGWELWQYCQRVIDGEIADDDTLIVIYAADPDDDWKDPAVWAKANPGFGKSVKADYLEAKCIEAQASPRLENDFKRYHLNIWTEQAVRWIQMDRWGPVGTDWAATEFEAELEGADCYAGIDLSSTTDLSALCLWFPPSGDRKKWRKLTRAFVPADNMAERIRMDRVPFDQWLARGAIFATPGNVIDYDFIKEQLFRDASRFRIKAVGIDPFLATQLAIQLQAEGLNVQFVRQGFLSLSAPSKEFERLVLSDMVDHGGHPVARWCVGNAAIATDAAGNIKPAKDKSTERIDVVAADINALACALAGDQAKPAPGIGVLD